jgi:septum formation protein
MRKLPDEALRRYVELERPIASAGSYMSEGLGIVLFEWLRGDDPTAIIGLPLLAVSRLLERAGFSPLLSRMEAT